MSQKTLKLNTNSVYDSLVIKFMNRITDENGDTVNILLGSEIYDLSSLVLLTQLEEQKPDEND